MREMLFSLKMRFILNIKMRYWPRGSSKWLTNVPSASRRWQFRCCYCRNFVTVMSDIVSHACRRFFATKSQSTVVWCATRHSLMISKISRYCGRIALSTPRWFTRLTKSWWVVSIKYMVWSNAGAVVVKNISAEICEFTFITAGERQNLFAEFVARKLTGTNSAGILPNAKKKPIGPRITANAATEGSKQRRNLIIISTVAESASIDTIAEFAESGQHQANISECAS